MEILLQGSGSSTLTRANAVRTVVTAIDGADLSGLDYEGLIGLTRGTIYKTDFPYINFAIQIMY